MPGRRLREPYSVDFFRNSVKDSLSYLGEEVILLSMYHVIPDEREGAPRCECFDDVYENSSFFKCPSCYGTTFAGGVKKATRCWAMFTDATGTDEQGKRGVWSSDKRSVQIEWYPPLVSGDYVVRMAFDGWTPDHVPRKVYGIYRIGEVVSDSMRQGQVQGQTPDDLVGQKGTVEDVSKDMPIWQFPIVGVRFDRHDGRVL